MKTVYTINSVEKFINDLLEQEGYTLEVLSEGTLGLGDGVLIAPDDKHYNFVYREIPVNEWSSVQTVRKCRRISARLQAEIDAARSRVE